MKACRSALYSFYTVTPVETEASLQYCPYDENDFRRLNDTCCSRESSWDVGCFPRPVNVTTQVYSLKTALDEQLATCQSAVCKLKILKEYL
jgi:hypothetical protein